MGIPSIGTLGKIGRSFAAEGRSVADIAASVRATAAEERMAARVTGGYTPRSLEAVKESRFFGNEVQNMNINNSIDQSMSARAPKISPAGDGPMGPHQRRNPMANDSSLAASIREKALNQQNLKQATADVTQNGKYSYFSGAERGRTVYNDGSVGYGEGFRGMMGNSYPAIIPKVDAPKMGPMFKINASDAPWKQALKVGAESTVDRLSKPFGKAAMRFAAPGVAGAAIGAVTGAVGNIAAPGSMENAGFVQSAFKGAAMGMALGVAGRAAGAGAAHMQTLNKVGSAGAAQAAQIGAGLNMVKTVAQSKATWGAIAVAGAAGAVNTNLTRPINGTI